MRRKNLLIGALILAVFALIAYTPTGRAVESWTQTLMTDVGLGPQTSGYGVLQTNRVVKGTDINSATLTQIIAAPATGQIFVDGVFLEKATATTGAVTLQYGTGTNCGTGTATLAYIGPATSTSLMPLGYYPLKIQVPAAKALCAKVDATTTDALVLAQ